jgi:hypothetical protein
MKGGEARERRMRRKKPHPLNLCLNASLLLCTSLRYIMRTNKAREKYSVCALH